MFVVGNKLFGDAEMVEQFSSVTCVLTCDHVDRPEDLDRTKGYVLKIPDGRRNQIECARHIRIILPYKTRPGLFEPGSSQIRCLTKCYLTNTLGTGCGAG